MTREDELRKKILDSAEIVDALRLHIEDRQRKKEDVAEDIMRWQKMVDERRADNEEYRRLRTDKIFHQTLDELPKMYPKGVRNMPADIEGILRRDYPDAKYQAQIDQFFADRT